MNRDLTRKEIAGALIAGPVLIGAAMSVHYGFVSAEQLLLWAIHAFLYIAVPLALIGSVFTVIDIIRHPDSYRTREQIRERQERRIERERKQRETQASVTHLPAHTAQLADDAGEGSEREVA
jgi:hypothetical protein